MSCPMLVKLQLASWLRLETNNLLQAAYAACIMTRLKCKGWHEDHSSCSSDSQNHRDQDSADVHGRSQKISFGLLHASKMEDKTYLQETQAAPIMMCTETVSGSPGDDCKRRGVHSSTANTIDDTQRQADAQECC